MVPRSKRRSADGDKSEGEKIINEIKWTWGQYKVAMPKMILTSTLLQEVLRSEKCATDKTKNIATWRRHWSN